MMSAGEYMSIILQAKSSTVMMYGATDKQEPQTIIPWPSHVKPSLTDFRGLRLSISLSPQ